MLTRREMVAGAGAVAALGAHGPAGAAAPVPEQRLRRFRDEAKALGARAIVIASSTGTLLSHGAVDEVLRIASIRKSLLSALYGIALAEGRIDLNATVGELGIDDYVPLTPTEKTARVRHLIQARSGVYLPTAAESPAMRAARPARGSHRPGTFWYYNNWDFNVAGEIYQRATGEDLFVAVEHRLARPLGWQDFDPLRDLRWAYDEENPRFPAYNMWMSARDMARFGQLYLRRGNWGGKQIVPARWIDESTAPFSLTGRSGWGSGYGYMWWIASDRNGARTEGLPAGSYSAAGNGGRWITVFPAHDLVVSVQPHEQRGKPQAPIYTDKTAYTRLLALLFA